MPNLRQVSTDLKVILLGMVIAGALMLFIPFPSDLVNRTYAAHHDEILSWFRPLASLQRLSKLEGSGLEHWLGFSVFTILSGALYSMLNPTFGLNGATLATIVGMAAALFVFSLIWALASSLYLQRRMDGLGHHLRIILSSLPLAIVCVAVSRLTHFQPGYLYGLVGGFIFTKSLSREQEGSSIAVAAGATVVLAVIAWLARLPFAELASGPAPPFAAAAADTFLAALFVLGIEHLVFRLLPIRFLDGAKLRAWSTVAWLILYGIGLFGFLHVLIDPVHGYTHLTDSKRAGLFSAVGLFVGFGLFSVLFWGYFRFRPQRDKAARS